MIDISFEFPHLAGRLLAAQDAINRELVVAIQTNRGMLFDSEGAHNGHDKWDQLQLRSGQILAQRGALKRSFAPGDQSGNAGPGGYVSTDGAGVVTLGTNVAYAAMMNWGTTRLPGGVLRPKRAQALRIPLPAGKSATPAARALGKGMPKDRRFIFRRWVRIPARRFDQLNEHDAAEFNAALVTVIAESIR